MKAIVFGCIQDIVIIWEIYNKKESFSLVWFVDIFESLSSIILVGKPSHEGWEEKVVILALHLFD